MTITATELSRLVTLIHQTPLRPEVWPLVMSSTAELLSSSVGVLIAQDIDTRAPAFAAVSAETPPELLDEYQAYYGVRDRMRNTVLASPDTVHVEDTLLSPDDRSRDEVYNDCYLRFGLGHAIGWSMRSSPFEATVVFGRPRMNAAFSEEEMDFCRMLIPHFGLAMAVRSRLASLETGQAAALDAINRVEHGVVFFGRDTRVLAMNAAASSMMAAADGLTCSRNELRAVRSDENRLLERLLASTCAAQVPFESRGGRMTVSRSDDRHPYSVVISPLSANHDRSTGNATAVAFIADPDRKTGGPPSLLGYAGLTRAEAEVAFALCCGQSLEEAAESRHIAISTARTHLKRILGKTRTTRQGELIGLLLRGPLAVGRETF